MQCSGIKKLPGGLACLIVFTVVCLLWAAQPVSSWAGQAAASLTIRYCYAGGEFTEAAVFAENDFSGAFEEGYSFMDSMPSPCMNAVTGVLLSDLLVDASIDMDDVDKLAFYTTDVPGRPAKTFAISDLYADRYYYPHIMEYWNNDSRSFTAEDGLTDVTAQAMADGVPVYPMICMSDNWVRGGLEPDFSCQDGSTRYRLAIGQTGDPAEVTAGDSIKWIYQIDVTLKGAGPEPAEPTGSDSTSAAPSSSVNKTVTGISLDKTTGIIDVGSTLQLEATVLPEEAADKSLIWNSSDTTIATISKTGLVTAVTPGTVTITVTTRDGGKTDSFSLKINPVEVKEPKVIAPDVVPTTAIIPTESEIRLNDISGHWAEDSIKHLVSLEAVGGYPDGGFKPDNTVTRAEFATMLVKAFGFTVYGETTFADTRDHWASEYISTAASNKIISGYGEGVFGPEELITREQMALMVMQAAKLDPANSVGFTDRGSISTWASGAVAAVIEKGIMKGYPDNTFKPQGNATRAEAVTTIFNALQ